MCLSRTCRVASSSSTKLAFGFAAPRDTDESLKKSASVSGRLKPLGEFWAVSRGEYIFLINPSMHWEDNLTLRSEIFAIANSIKIAR